MIEASKAGLLCPISPIDCGTSTCMHSMSAFGLYVPASHHEHPGIPDGLLPSSESQFIPSCTLAPCTRQLPILTWINAYDIPSPAPFPPPCMCPLSLNALRTKSCARQLGCMHLTLAKAATAKRQHSEQLLKHCNFTVCARWSTWPPG